MFNFLAYHWSDVLLALVELNSKYPLLNKAKRSAKQQRSGAYLFLFAGIAEKRYSEMVTTSKREKKSYIGELLTAADRCKKLLWPQFLLELGQKFCPSNEVFKK